MATQPNQITISTQAFLILCRLFDGCYDDLKKQEELSAVVESTAQTLLDGVTALKQQEAPVKEITLSIPFEAGFFLRKLLREMLARLEGQDTDGKNRRWLEECLVALGG
ncbi:hypothetical protein [Brevibacillus sp. SYP-B805]|uniref:hypothetical protein n=1 Tax=Brevibacillus sp. SYP-B805 TaxID=1578199 RepID=UPI003217AC63